MCRAVQPGGAASDCGEQWRAVPGVGVPAGDVRPGGAGAALLTQQGALPWSPHPLPTRAQIVV